MALTLADALTLNFGEFIDCCCFVSFPGCKRAARVPSITWHGHPLRSVRTDESVPPLTAPATGRARCSGDYDGVTRRSKKHGRTTGSAERALRVALRDRVHVGAGAEITPDTKIAVFAEVWFAEISSQDRSPGTSRAYRDRLDRQVIPALGRPPRTGSRQQPPADQHHDDHAVEELGVERQRNGSSAVTRSRVSARRAGEGSPAALLWQRPPHADSRTALVAVDCGQPQVPGR
jgi:hypothetical protein